MEQGMWAALMKFAPNVLKRPACRARAGTALYHQSGKEKDRV